MTTDDALEATAVMTIEPLEGYLSLPAYARSTAGALARACGATMTAPGGGNEGEGTGSGDGEEGEGATALSYSDVLSALPDDQRAAIVAEVSKKNSEARQQRQRAKAAEQKIADAAAGDAGSGTGGQNGDQQRPQEGQQNGNGQQNGAGQQRPSEGTESRQQLATARVAVARSKIEAIAATAGFADPEDAGALLGDLSSYVDNDFTVDTDAIRSDVDELLVKKPHLRKQPQEGQQQQNGGRPGRPAPDRSQGSSASGGNGAKRSGTVDAGAEEYRRRHPRRAATNN